MVRSFSLSGPARRLRADGDATRARILEAAGKLYSAVGFAETTNKAIATRANVDLASINYHFGSRDGLYQAVLIEAHSRLVSLDDLQQLAQSNMSAAAKLNALLDQLARQATPDRQGWHVPVLAREILAPSSHIKVLYQSELQPKLLIVENLFSQITCIPRGDSALACCMLSVAAPCLMLLIGRTGLPGPMQRVLQMPYDVISDHLRRFALAGLEAAGRDYARRTNQGTRRGRQHVRR